MGERASLANVRRSLARSLRTGIGRHPFVEISAQKASLKSASSGWQRHDRLARADSADGRPDQAMDRLGVRPGGYFVATVHRPSNVDDPSDLARVVDVLREAGRRLPVLLVAHP